MDDKRLTQLSKRLSWLLRHGAGKESLPMDAAGWVAVDVVLRHLGMRAEEFTFVVKRNNKARFQLREGFVRASQGHSLEAMPVTRDALEASWEVWPQPGPAYHGTHLDALPSIARDGLLPGARSHVHMAATPNSVVGKRAHVHFLLEVSAQRMRRDGFELYLSSNGVVLARRVPPRCIVGLRAETRRARERLREVQQLFHWIP